MRPQVDGFAAHFAPFGVANLSQPVRSQLPRLAPTQLEFVRLLAVNIPARF